MASSERWVASWASPPSDLVTLAPRRASWPFADITLRTAVRLSAGGGAIRLRLANDLGVTPLAIGGAHIARSKEGLIDAATIGAVRFGGRDEIVIPAGTSAFSDPVPLPVPALGELTVSLYVPGPVEELTAHMVGLAPTLALTGNRTSAPELPGASFSSVRHLLSQVDVLSADGGAGCIAVIGDSISDGHVSSFGANRRWTDFLATRLAAAGHAHRGIANLGISGNRLLSDGDGLSVLNRAERDIFTLPGLDTIICLVGVNDLGYPAMDGAAFPSARDMIAGYEALLAKARARSVRMIGCTIMPFAGAGPGFFTVRGEEVRTEVNAWIRTGAGFQAVIDFDRLCADPRDPMRLAPFFDSGDGLHPADAGYEAMADSLPLGILAAPN